MACRPVGTNSSFGFPPFCTLGRFFPGTRRRNSSCARCFWLAARTYNSHVFLGKWLQTTHPVRLRTNSSICGRTLRGRKFGLVSPLRLTTRSLPRNTILRRTSWARKSIWLSLPGLLSTRSFLMPGVRNMLYRRKFVIARWRGIGLQMRLRAMEAIANGCAPIVSGSLPIFLRALLPWRAIAAFRCIQTPPRLKSGLMLGN